MRSVALVCFFRALAMSFCGLAFTVNIPLSAQSGSPKTTHKQFVPETDISLGIFGQMTPARTPTTETSIGVGDYFTQKTQGASASPGVLGTFHQSLRPWLGYNVNLGYSRFSENYSEGQAFVPSAAPVVGPTGVPITPQAYSSYSRGSIGTNMYELTIAYAVRGPGARRFHTFARFGGGGLFFLPTQRDLPGSQETRPAMVFGVGMNYRLSTHLDLRAEYRGLFYKSPDFAYQRADFPLSKLFTVTNAPAVSLVYRFGSPKRYFYSAMSPRPLSMH